MDLVTTNRVRSAVDATLQAWLPWYLAEAERSDGLDAGHVDRPRAWRLALAKDGLPSHTQLPMVVVTVPTMQPLQSNTPDHFDGVFTAQINVLLRGKDYDDTAVRCGLYATAVQTLMAQQRSLDGTAYNVLVNEPAVLDLNVETAQRTLGEVLVEAQVYVSCIAPRYPEPLTAPVDLDPVEEPTVLTVSTDLEPEEA